ncbi:MAG: T9SS type A sorting domain-containing protein [Candidatus Zixiibacteriota bacterium]|nr:MAG: T9SS type A sorting domain-containing protein [candidate division Zixibacteria bacterium]
MNVKGLHILAIVVALMMPGEASGQDPDLQDSLIIGNFNGSVIPVGLNQEIVLPVWIKTDDSVTFFHTPLATDNNYIVLRLGGGLYEPLSLWDEVGFLTPNPNSPSPGMTSQSILGFAYLFDPRDPQNFLYTDYEWWHVADFHMLTTSDTTAIGDTVCLIEGFNPANGGLLWGIPDGVTQIVPAAIYPCLYFSDNAPPEFSQPVPGTEFLVNNEFPINFLVIATDADNHVISITVYFPEDGAQFDTVFMAPGYSSYMFSWLPDFEDTGQFIATFTADDNHGGVVNLDVAINVSRSILQVDEVSAFPGMDVSVPVNIINPGETSYIGGFDILLQYGIPEIIDLLSVVRGPLVESWEYFHVTLGDTSTIRITGIADIYGNGNMIPPGEGPIAFLNFEISGDSVYVGHYAEINFIYADGNDNTISDSTGYLLIHPDVDSGWVYNQDPSNVLIGDINLNEIAWEISDAVLLVNHIIAPLQFPFNYVQMLASDTNRDGVPATVPDLIYIISVINGYIIPPRINYENETYASVVAEFDEIDAEKLIFRYESSIPAGGILMRLDHGRNEIRSLSTNTGMDLLSDDESGILSVMLLDYDGGVILPGEEIFEMTVSDGSVPIVTELQISDQYGNFIPAGLSPVSSIPEGFTLYGAYPNPFNSSTTIKFSLPQKTDVDLSIYNMLGQLVKSFRFENMNSGERSISWDGSGDSGDEVSSGVYLYRITAGGYEAASRLTLLK